MSNGWTNLFSLNCWRITADTCVPSEPRPKNNINVLRQFIAVCPILFALICTCFHFFFWSKTHFSHLISIILLFWYCPPYWQSLTVFLSCGTVLGTRLTKKVCYLHSSLALFISIRYIIDMNFTLNKNQKALILPHYK